MNTPRFPVLPVTFLRARLLAQWKRAAEKPLPDRAAMLILSSRLNALGRAT